MTADLALQLRRLPALDPSEATTTRNALIEGALLHARVLNEFLTSDADRAELRRSQKSAGEDTMLAEDFVSGWTRKQGRLRRSRY